MEIYKELGMKKIPVIVRNLDRDEAIISMVDSNLKREEISLWRRPAPIR